MHATVYGPFSGTTQVSQCQKKKSYSGLYGVWEDNKGRLTDNLAACHSIRTNQCPLPPSLHIFLRAGCHSCHPTNSVKTLKATNALPTTSLLVHGQVTIIFVVSVCLCSFFSRLRSDLDQTRTHVTSPGLVVSLEYRGCATPGGWVTPTKLVFLGVLG